MTVKKEDIYVHDAKSGKKLFRIKNSQGACKEKRIKVKARYSHYVDHYKINIIRCVFL